MYHKGERNWLSLKSSSALQKGVMNMLSSSSLHDVGKATVIFRGVFLQNLNLTRRIEQAYRIYLNI
ncbi:hypothetical protein DPMN_166776 [Dreissena polymorpha]|uniref:Uncharacterized protein n=1 Tax=Dreissena polymorpha TaxID=45954 RepID=A0A9D4IXP7_DREPO|nr:hypothetical protein DPMN_166776 [Dreissena polymorpha]